jgi:hypothetical protein
MFHMDNANPVNIPRESHFRLNKDQSPKHEQEHDYMVSSLHLNN